MKAHLTCVLCMWSPLAPVKAGPHNGTLKLHWKIEGLLYTVYPLLASHGKPAQWMDGWMDGWMGCGQDAFFHWVFVPSAKLPHSWGFQKCGGGGGSKIGFHPTGWCSPKASLFDLFICQSSSLFEKRNPDKFWFRMWWENSSSTSIQTI
jgi:hypothetical protein